MFGWTSARIRGSDTNTTNSTGAYFEGEAGVMSGLAANTQVATATGWRSVDAISVGEKVLTFDAGLQPVTKVLRLDLWASDRPCPQSFWPLEVPIGALVNRDVMRLLPNQSVMVESDTAEEIYGDPFSLIPAAALEGLSGIHRIPPPAGLEVIVLHFETEQVVFANSGALFLCPSSLDLVASAFAEAPKLQYAILPLSEARVLADDIEAEAGRVCVSNPINGMAAA